MMKDDSGGSGNGDDRTPDGRRVTKHEKESLDRHGNEK